VIIKQVDARTRAKTSINELLRDRAGPRSTPPVEPSRHCALAHRPGREPALTTLARHRVADPGSAGGDLGLH
jgi:hypothetical protein